MTTKKIWKRCAKCGYVGRASAYKRRCTRQRFGQASYWCYGDLVVVSRRATPPLTESAKADRTRASAARRLKQAQVRVARTRTRIKRLQTALRHWQVKVRRFEKRVGLSDTALAAERARLAKATQVRVVRHRLAVAAGVARENPFDTL